MFSNILVVLQGKPSDDIVAGQAVELAQTYQAKVTFLRVITIMGDGPKNLGHQFQTEIGSSGWKRKNKAGWELSRIKEHQLARGVPIVTAIVVGDRSYADEILAYADLGNYELLIMVSDNHSWIRCLLSDCPAGGVRRKAQIPVLFVNDATQPVSVTPKVIENQERILAMFGEPCL
ncbi:MAG: universal stress protein [Chloroflexota bacterium]|nr:MAG: universal stress protein [Chloroflexota bacterium]